MLIFSMISWYTPRTTDTIQQYNEAQSSRLPLSSHNFTVPSSLADANNLGSWKFNCEDKYMQPTFIESSWRVPKVKAYEVYSTKQVKRMFCCKSQILPEDTIGHSLCPCHVPSPSSTLVCMKVPQPATIRRYS
jgi:hypothetical protein